MSWTDPDGAQRTAGVKRRNRPGCRERLRKKRRNPLTMVSSSVTYSEPGVELLGAAGWEDQSATQHLARVGKPTKPGRRQRLRRRLRKQFATMSLLCDPPEPARKQPPDTLPSLVTQITASLKFLNLRQVTDPEKSSPSKNKEAEGMEIIREAWVACL